MADGAVVTESAQALLKAIEDMAGVRYKHDLGTPISLTTNLTHGTGGIFGVPGIGRDVFATRVKPRGLMQILPAVGSIWSQPLVAYLTGFTDDENVAEKDKVCDVPPAAGQMKSCLQGALFGRVERKTEQFEITQAMNPMNQGETLDLRIINDPLIESGLSVPSSIPREAGNVLMRQVLALWMNLGVALERKLGPLTFTGNPSNNSAGGGYQEFHGLETLVGTGKIDVITNNVCSALNSDLRNFGYKRIDQNGSNLVAVLTSMVRYINDIATRTGLDPVQHVFAMRRNLFDDLADIWPCAYGTYRCTASGVSDPSITQLVVDAGAQRQMAEDMRNGKYLMIDGVKIPVIIDDFIPEDSQITNSNVRSGCFASDIYYLPLTVRGGIVSLFYEYYDFSAANGVMQAVVDGHMTDDYWTDGGRYLWTKQRTGWCMEWWAMIKPRLRLLTPHLAGRLQNVAYCPALHFREDEPTSPYFFDGGSTSRTNTQYDKNDFPAAQT